MKYIKSIMVALAISLLSLNAQTNSVASEESGKSSGGIELTLGGGGTEIKGESLFGFDFSLSTNPFEKRPEVWVGVAQGLYWEPTFSGSTDLFTDWSWNLWKEVVYLNTGWSVGVLYDTSSEVIWRTGPEATLQYYVGDSAFIYVGLNWDFVSKGDDGLRYGFGIGIAL